ncbi:hypothetical protein C8Q78DRAFT_1076962 [Trametes maxima]|nr:hypothetical protein C8Q78DRAFT_1076962 [Trametes maxima]
MDDGNHDSLPPVNPSSTEHGPGIDIDKSGTDKQTDESSHHSAGDVRVATPRASFQGIEAVHTSAANAGRNRVLCDDIIIDQVIQCLDLEDVARLRQVCQQFWECSTEAAVWKRRLERAKHRLPPVPPTARYSFANLSTVESERLLLRCASLAREWDVDVPRYQHRWKIEVYREILEMVLLPGGQYMVASVANEAWTRFAIEVFTADFKYAVGAPLAHLDVPTKAFELRAKYMTFRGTPGIVIAYVRRDYRRARDVERFDVNALPSDHQPCPGDRQLQYECAVAHVPLAASELLGDGTIPQHSRKFREVAKKLARPFHILTEIISRSRLSNPVIDDDVGGAPLVAVLKHAEGVADRIIYKNLDGGPATTLMGTPHPDLPALPHAIMAFSIIPIQKQFLVIRRAGDNVQPIGLDNGVGEHTAPYYFSEFWDIVEEPGATLTRDAAARGDVFDCEGNYWEKVWISDHGLGPSLTHDRSLRAQLLSSGERPVLRPILVFVRAKDCGGIPYSALFPAGHPLARHPLQETQTPAPYRYAFTHSFLQFDTDALGDEDGTLDGFEFRVLPGAVRPLVYTVQRRGACAHRFDVHSLSGIWDRALVHAGDSEAAQAIAEAVKKAEEGEGEHGGVDGVIMLNGEVVAGCRYLDVPEEDLREVSAIAWDETIGRLCVARAGMTRVDVFDFATAPLRA